MHDFTIFSDFHKPLLRRIRELAHNILSNEIGCEVKRERFLWNGYWIPLSFAIFEGADLGKCTPSLFQIAINIRVLNSGNWEAVNDILRHEIAHLLTYLEYPNSASPHGPEFLKICQKYFSKEISKARIDPQLIFDEQNELKIERMISKVHKLFSLGQSSNSHEALLAMQKANQILLQFNLDLEQLDQNNTYMLSLIEGTRCQEKHRSIAKIVQEFYVAPLFSFGKKKFFLQAVGSKANVQFAQYLAVFLDRELERLWSVNKGEIKNSLRAKNSFFRGIAMGFAKKMSQDKKNMSENFLNQDKDQMALILLNQEEQLKIHLDRAFPKRSSSYSSAITDNNWAKIGKSTGENLSFNRPLENAKNSPLFFLEQ